jgi:hypothetical protein
MQRVRAFALVLLLVGFGLGGCTSAPYEDPGYDRAYAHGDAAPRTG